jgi:hypothetical protein
MRAILIQTSDAVEYAAILAATSRTVLEFCRRHDLEYRNFTGIKCGYLPWHSTYNRIVMMKELLEEGHLGWVLYLDADAYVCNLDFPVADYLEENDRFAMVAVRINSTAEYWDINAGVIFMNLGHPLGRRIVAELVERLAAATRAPQFIENQWPDTDLWLDDQSLLHTTLIENPDWQAFVRYESQTFMNSLHASFIRHHLRAMTPDLADRLRSIEAEVDLVLRSSADEIEKR